MSEILPATNKFFRDLISFLSAKTQTWFPEVWRSVQKGKIKTQTKHFTSLVFIFLFFRVQHKFAFNIRP